MGIVTPTNTQHHKKGHTMTTQDPTPDEIPTMTSVWNDPDLAIKILMDKYVTECEANTELQAEVDRLRVELDERPTDYSVRCAGSMHAGIESPPGGGSQICSATGCFHREIVLDGASIGGHDFKRSEVV